MSENEKVIKSGIIAVAGMTMDLSEAANALPEGHILHWHTVAATPVEQEVVEQVNQESVADSEQSQEA